MWPLVGWPHSSGCGQHKLDPVSYLKEKKKRLHILEGWGVDVGGVGGKIGGVNMIKTLLYACKKFSKN